MWVGVVSYGVLVLAIASPDTLTSSVAWAISGAHEWIVELCLSFLCDVGFRGF